MSESTGEPNKKPNKLAKAKKIVKDNWIPFTVGVVITGVTVLITKQLTASTIRIEGSGIFIDKAFANEGPLFKVFNIYGDGFKNHGPSWMVKCKETGALFRSQEHAAKVMGLSRSAISSHLNNPSKYPSVEDYHFERLGVAV